MHSYSSFSSALNPHMVVQPASDAQVTCYWCHKVIQACDGTRTLKQVSELLHLPLAVCMKLVGRAQQQGWVEVSEQQGADVPLWTSLLSALGEEGHAILEQAAQMSRIRPGQIPAHEVGNFLIAVELLLPEVHRESLIPVLDRLGQQYSL